MVKKSLTLKFRNLGECASAVREALVKKYRGVIEAEGSGSSESDEEDQH